MGGSLDLISSPEHGTTVAFELPIAAEASSAETQTSSMNGHEYSISFERIPTPIQGVPNLKIVHQIPPRDHAPDRSSVLALECACLSDSEQQAVALVAQGFTDQEIADQIFVSTRSVQNYLNKARKKLGLRGRAQIARWAADHNLVR
jgi:DNA-binding CsgD family transcriptional regulator